MKNLDIKNKSSMFAAIPDKNRFNVDSSGFFCGHTKAIICKDIRLSNPCRLLRLRCNDSCRKRGGDSLSYLYNLILNDK